MRSVLNYVELKNITKTYGTEVVLNVPYYKIPLDGIVTIVGFSGNGKTTLLNIIGLLDLPDVNHEAIIVYQIGNDRYEISYTDKAIHIQRDGTAIDVDLFRRKFLGFIFQENMLHPSLSASNNVLMPLRASGLDYQESISTLFEDIGLDELRNKSGGQKQRTSILRALIKKPFIIFADEPTSSLDLPRASQALETFSKFNTIWVTHDMLLAKKFSKYIIVVEKGNLCKLKNNQDDFDVLGALEEGCKSNTHKDLAQNNNINIGQNNFASLGQKISFIFDYAVNDLFKPKKDFWLLFAILVVSFMAVLGIYTIEHSLRVIIDKYLTDPRVSYIQVAQDSATGGVFKEEDFDKFKRAIQTHPILNKKCKLFKQKMAVISFANGNQGNTLSLSTYERDDPLFVKMSQDNAFKSTSIDIFKEATKHPIWIEKNLNFAILSKAAQFQHEIYNQPQTQLGSLESIDVDLIYSDRDLPFGYDIFIRDLLFDTIFPDYKVKNFSIVFYPKDIKTSLSLIKWLKDGKNNKSIIDQDFYIIDETDKFNSLKLISTIENIVSVMMWIVVASVVLLLGGILGLNIYNNIKQKYKELGIMLSFGMPKRYFFAFYATKAILLSVLSVISSFLLYHFIVSPILVTYLTKNLFQDILAIAKTGEQQIINIGLPISMQILIFSMGTLFIMSLFMVFTRIVIYNTPAKLIKGANE